MSVRTQLRSLWMWFDRCLGRGSYRWIKPLLAPYQDYSYFAYARIVSRLARPGVRWLDAGCGHQILEGRLENEEKDLIARARLAVGCDAFVDSLQRHRNLRNRACCNLDRLPFQDGSFDLVTLNMVAEHLVQPEQTFSEIARVLDVNGLLLLHTPNANSYEVKLTRFCWKVAPKSVGLKMIRFLEHREPEDVFPTFYRANTRSELSTLMRELGLTEVEFQFIECRPFFYFFVPISVLEILFVKLLRAIGRHEASSANFVGVYQHTKHCVLPQQTSSTQIPTSCKQALRLGI
jgi:ubiquinone/menaquinone biosynthesis C-methylase UbiE